MNALDYEIIVVDDGSRDGTFAVATRLAAGDPHVRVLQHERNRGYGAALRTGIAAAREPWVLLTDADLQFDLGDLAGFVALAADHDLIAGYRRQAQRPAPPRAAAAVWNWLVGHALGLHVRDVDCAFKLIRRETLDGVELTSSGAAISAELLARSARAGSADLRARRPPPSAQRRAPERAAAASRGPGVR